jgi:tetratricopeptide (TPR) repeat protein
VESEVILGGVALVLTGWILWKLRRRKMALLGVLWFGIALAPSSQIVLHHISRADRFLYLPLVGLALAAAASLRPLGNRFEGRRAVAAMVPGVLVLLLLSVSSARQVQTWRDEIAMWENCLRVDPGNVLAHLGLATILANRERYQAAMSHYRAALSIDPDHGESLMYFGLLLATCPRESLRDYDLAVQLASKACAVADPPPPAAIMILAEVYAQAGRLDMAIATTEKGRELTRSLGYLKLSDEFHQRLELYQKRSANGRAP